MKKSKWKLDCSLFNHGESQPYLTTLIEVSAKTEDGPDGAFHAADFELQTLMEKNGNKNGHYKVLSCRPVVNEPKKSEDEDFSAT